MSKFDTWLEAARLDKGLHFADQSCFNLKIVTRSDFNELCAKSAPCATCALYNNVGMDYIALLDLLGIQDE